MEITSKQRSKLRAMAATLPTIAQVGKGGISKNSIQSLSAALEAHELIKIHVLQNANEEIQEITEELIKSLDCICVATIGKKIILYRRSSRKNFEHIQF